MSSQASALSVVVNAQADARRYIGQTFRERVLMPEISTGHHNPITPQDRDTRSSSASLAVAVIPFLTTALFTAGRHCDDFML